MSKSDTFENEFLALVFNGVPISNLADNAQVSPLADLHVALHTADPGEGGDQSVSEATYSGYARTAVARDGSGWTVTGGSVSPTSEITFPVATAGSESLTYMSIGVATSGATKILYRGILTPPIGVSQGVTPILTTNTVISED